MLPTALHSGAARPPTRQPPGMLLRAAPAAPLVLIARQQAGSPRMQLGRFFGTAQRVVATASAAPQQGGGSVGDSSPPPALPLSSRVPRWSPEEDARLAAFAAERGAAFLQQQNRADLFQLLPGRSLDSISSRYRTFLAPGAEARRRAIAERRMGARQQAGGPQGTGAPQGNGNSAGVAHHGAVAGTPRSAAQPPGHPKGWTPEEDAQVLAFAAKHGPAFRQERHRAELALLLPSRTPKGAYDRYRFHLGPNAEEESRREAERKRAKRKVYNAGQIFPKQP